jgi:hypothetical protein
MQVIHIQVTGTGIMLTTSTMATIIMPHRICKMLLITTLLELMLTLISWLIWMVMFTGIVDLESINPMSMRGRCITLSMPTTQQNIVLEVQRVQQGGQVIQELLEQTVLEV